MTNESARSFVHSLLLFDDSSATTRPRGMLFLAARNEKKFLASSHSSHFRLLRASVLVLRPKIAGFFRERMEKGRHLVSYADEHVPRSRPLFAGIHVRDGYFPSKSAFLRILLAEGSATKRRRLSFGNHREWRRRENSRDKKLHMLARNIRELHEL